MKTCLRFLLILHIMTGCAPGYYETGAPYQGPSERFEGMSFNNPETPEEKSMRILQEGMGR
jgi:hypothetical protein